MSTLGEQRREFSLALSILITWAFREGYAVAIDDVKAHDGHKEGSFHYKGLAADLQLYKLVNGRWEWQTSTEAHIPIGEQWKRMGGTWGGDFSRKDGNHYSWGER